MKKDRLLKAVSLGTKITAALLAAFYLLFIFGEGLNWISLPSGEKIYMAFFLISVAGLALGLRWELTGGILAILGMAGNQLAILLFYQKFDNLLIWDLHYLIGAGYLFCWYVEKRRPK